MATPRIVIDRDIAPFDPWADMMGAEQPVFSSNMMAEFLAANADADIIEVEIRSNGGSTSEARICFDQLKGSGKTIKTLGYKVHSSAVILFLAGSERLISENADMLIHPVWIDAFSLPWQLSAEDLQDFADEIKKEEEKLKDIYASVIGQDKMEEVGQLMANSTTLSASEAIRLGFATGKLGDTASTENKGRALAYTNKFAQLLQNKKQGDMKSIAEVLKNLSDKIDNLTNKEEEEKKEKYNGSAALSEGGEVYFAEDALAEGVAVFMDEAMAEAAPDGDHLLADGNTITVSGGVVTAIVSPSAAENTADVTDLTNKVEGIESNITALAETVNKLADTVKTMNATVSKFQNATVADSGKAYPERTKDVKDMTFQERVLNRAKSLQTK